jgi:GNAT superfamily N-acetyltransferase
MAGGFASSDRTLALRLESAEAANAVAMTLIAGLHGVVAESIAGGMAVFAGARSAMTHALGIGLHGPVPETELERLERFFAERNTPCVIDLCPLADTSVLAFLQNRPYRLIEVNNVLVRRVGPDDVLADSPGVRVVDDGELPLWSRVVSEGFAEHTPPTPEMIDLMAAMCRGSRCWAAGGEQPVAGAAMGIAGGVAILFSDATLPRARRQGWQSALIRARLEEARLQGCDLAMASVLPGGASHRNYERHGFELLYTRVNLLREFAVFL